MKENKGLLETTYIFVGFSLIALVLTGSIFLINKTKNLSREYGYIGRTPEQINTMYFSGEGKVNTQPDIAIVSMGLSVQKYKVSDAQKESSQKMNAFINKVKEMGVEAKDIKTENYNIYTQYDWASGRQVFKGYELSQNVKIKIRDLDKISDIISLAGDYSLNQVGNLTFDIDNKEEFIKQAREEAIQKAKENAIRTANELGIELGRIISFNESSGASQIYNGYRLMDSAKAMNESVSGSAQIESGSADIIVNVNIGYELQ